MTSAIEVSSVSKHFGTTVAVRDVTLRIPQGQCFGLIGPNGAGKTTLFSMVCGFLKPSTGVLRVMGRDASKSGNLKTLVGALPQDAVLPPAWEVGALLTYWAKLSGLAHAEAEARNALEKVNLIETWKVKAGALSHGMAKRVALAQALMGNPPVLCLDEPTAGLDPKIAALVRALILDLKGRHTLLVSSHNIDELEQLCDASAILDHGRLVTQATMSELTSIDSEFRILVASGSVPVDEVKNLMGCTAATFSNLELRVKFDAQKVSTESIISQTLRLLLERGVLVLEVSRGHRLEDKVLALT